jgi:hypothetical protein
MINPENSPNENTRASQLSARIEELRKIKIINQSDPTYAAEISEEIEKYKEELNELNKTRH